MKTIEYHLDKADKLAEKQVIKIVRKVLRNNKDVNEFMIAMGSYFFMDKNRKTLYNFKSKRLDNFILKYNSRLKITGNSMNFKAYGKIIRHW